MLRLSVDTKALVAELQARARAFRRAGEAAMLRASEAVVALFRRKWLSGQTGADLGLNIRTQNLYNSLQANARQDGDALLGEVTNQGADYWWYHEHPQGGRPQRLHLEDDFQVEGEPLYVGELDRAMEAMGA
jgi:hypothetical protein